VDLEELELLDVDLNIISAIAPLYYGTKTAIAPAKESKLTEAISPS
jgi:hypothetical protein